MRVLLINAPSRKGEGGFMLPLGLLTVGGILERAGHEVKVLDLYAEKSSEGIGPVLGKMTSLLEEYKPSLVGFGGIASSYGTTKELSSYIRRYDPNIVQIAGGPLSSTYDLLLTKAGLDAVFHSETEISLPLFMERLVSNRPFTDVPGLSCLCAGKVVRNAPAEQIKNLDELPYPAYHLVDIHRYTQTLDNWHNRYALLHKANPHYGELLEKIGSKVHYLPILTSRGCTHRCSFCYRHVRGIRQQSVGYVLEHMKHLQKTYGLGGFQFVDELFNVTPNWVMEFCDAIDREKIDIFYLVNGARVSNVNEPMLHRLKQTGCIQFDYGQESGSDTILKEYKKGVTAQQNKDITLLTRRVGMLTVVSIVVGSPGETPETIAETIQFLKDVEAYDFVIYYLTPFPETPIWEHALDKKLIVDAERYLEDVASAGAVTAMINLTSHPDHVWRTWGPKVTNEIRCHYYRKTKSWGEYCSFVAWSHLRPLLPAVVRSGIRNTARKYLKL